MPRYKYMGNSYFQFKAFRVEQGQTAMKVCTDSCAMGAYIRPAQAQRILDIGTGTGLLALMIAQRTPETTRIDALEIDAQAAAQATENIEASNWAARMQVLQCAVQSFDPPHRYDLIVCNPPFYENHLKRGTHAQNLAMHSEQLSNTELAIHSQRLLTENGRVVILLPPYQAQIQAQQMQAQGLFLEENCLLFDREGGKIIRHISTYSRKQNIDVQTNTLTIRDENNQYTPEFIALLQPYYLHL